MENISFADEEKARFFDEIANHFYNTNFGLLSKNEFDLLMFRFYYEKLILENTFEDGSVNYSNCSDYRIGKALGITPQRVKNLKIKCQLAYPRSLEWKKAFAKLIENARYDKSTQKVVMNIPDPNLLLEIQDFIESSGAYVEKQLNGKILQLRVEYYIDLIVALEPENTRKKIIKSLKQMLHQSEKENAAFDEKCIGKSLINAPISILDIATNLSDILSPENLVGKAIVKLVKQWEYIVKQ